MATFSACSINFACLPTLQSGKVNGLKWAYVGTSKRANRPSRYSKFHIFSQAKPETVDKVIAIVRKTLALAPDSPITPATTFAGDLGADSLDTVEIVMGLEEAFDITVEEDSAQSITNVQEAADVIEKLIEDKAKAAA